MIFNEPTGLFSGLMLDAYIVCVPELSSLSFLKEWHSLAQWPGLPQLWHLPLCCCCFLLLGAVAARASSVVEFFFPPCPLACLLFYQLAFLHIWLIRASRLIGAELFMIRAEDRRCKVNIASLLGMPWSMVCSYFFFITDTSAVASSSYSGWVWLVSHGCRGRCYGDDLGLGEILCNLREALLELCVEHQI